MNKKITIGITDCEKYPNYEKWILTEPNVEVIRLGYHFSNFKEIEKCEGILLTGGEDVHPKFYNKPELIEFCDDDIDVKRDEFELNVVEYSQKNKLPLLGICRGLQITNVYFEGTLLPDLPTFGKFNHSKFGGGKDKYHSVLIDNGTLLNEVTQVHQGEINSAHHQSADRVGKSLVASAISPEGVIEALERKKSAEDSFLLLVQWHPERMSDQKNVMVATIKKEFLDQVVKGVY